MVAVTAEMMADMQSQINALRDELQIMRDGCNGMRAVQTHHQEFLTDTNTHRMIMIMWESYSVAHPELRSVFEAMDERTTANLKFMQDRIDAGIAEMKKNQDWITQRQPHGSSNDQQQMRQKASESKVISCLKMLRDKREFKQLTAS